MSQSNPKENPLKEEHDAFETHVPVHVSGDASENAFFAAAYLLFQKMVSVLYLL